MIYVWVRMKTTLLLRPCMSASLCYVSYFWPACHTSHVSVFTTALCSHFSNLQKQQSMLTGWYAGRKSMMLRKSKCKIQLLKLQWQHSKILQTHQQPSWHLYKLANCLCIFWQDVVLWNFYIFAGGSGLEHIVYILTGQWKRHVCLSVHHMTIYHPHVPYSCI